MSKNIKRDNLENEIAALPSALAAARDPGAANTVVLARYMRDISEPLWREASRQYDLEKWHIYEIDDSGEISPEENEDLFAAPVFDAPGALSPKMFGRQLQKEMSRLNRNGGSLSLISLAIADRRGLNAAVGAGTAARLEKLLGSAILNRLEDCDCMGILKKEQYICSLPGVGQLAARNVAEKIKKDFEETARPFFPSGGVSGGKGARCAVGIVNVAQGETGAVRDLIKRAKTALELAQNKDETLMYQEASFSPLENPTLVQSSEKRFLFFGGDTE